jgi:hypothetical protein
MEIFKHAIYLSQPCRNHVDMVKKGSGKENFPIVYGPR